MAGVFLTILQIIGIVLLCIGGFIAFAAVTPFRYKAEASYHDEPFADVKASWLLGFLRIFVNFADGKPKVLVKLLIFTVFDSSKKKKKKKKKKGKGKKNKASAKRKVKSAAGKDDDDEKPFELEDSDGEETDFSEKSLKEKFIFVMDKISAFLKGTGEKINSLAEWLDKDHRRLYAFLWTNGLKIFKKIKPKKFDAYIAGGTGDPSSTGLIVSVVSVLLGFAGINTVRLDPDFEEKKIDADVNASGYFFVFPILFLALKIYRNKDFRKFILKK